MPRRQHRAAKAASLDTADAADGNTGAAAATADRPSRSGETTAIPSRVAISDPAKCGIRGAAKFKFLRPVDFLRPGTSFVPELGDVVSFCRRVRHIARAACVTRGRVFLWREK
jgi:hypothetical protein